MRRALMLASLAVLTARSSAAQELVGEWFGILDTGAGALRLALHITKSPAGFAGSMDSLDQSAMGLKLGGIALDGSSLKFRVDSVGGSYEGKLSSDSNRITGQWIQLKPLDLNLYRLQPSDIDGTWSGTLDLPSIRLRLVTHVTHTAAGYLATLVSVDQGNVTIPVTAVQRDGAAFRFEAASVEASYEGKLDKDLNRIEGTFTQGSAVTPLVLTRTRPGETAHRPQVPIKPYPYREEEVVYENQRAAIKLGGALTIPQGKGPFPTVLLITGSGQQDRDETIADHKPFLVLADYLTRRGIAVLRVDDRGVGKSGGDFGASTTADFATDVEAGVAYLKTRAEVNPRKIGLVGHSEGGVIAPLVAARNHDVAFIVMLAGTGVPGGDIIVEQLRAALLAQGAPQEQADTAAAVQREVINLIRDEKDGAEMKRKLRDKLTGMIPESNLDASLAQLTSPWYRYFVTFDPSIPLARTTCPVLALLGEKDTQVPARQNLPAIRKALEQNKSATVEVLTGLNHLFQTAKTGSPTEYGQIEETIAPAALAKIGDWISRQ